MSMVRLFVIGALCLAAAMPAAAQDDARERARERAREQAARVREQAQRQRQQQLEQRRRRADLERGPEYTESFSRTLRLGRNGTFDLSNVSGDIVITGGNGDDVRIDAVKRVRQRREEDARALLQQLEIVIAERTNQVDVRTEFPRNRNNFSGSVDYTVTLPNSANVNIRTVSGDLRVTNVRGELRAESVSGDVTAISTGRIRFLKTISGDLLLTDAEAEDVTASTVSGEIVVRNLKARSIDLELVSGDARLSEVNADRVNLKTISGDIDYQGRLARNGRYQMQSQSGDIRLVPSDEAGFDLDATSFSGDIRTDVSFRTGGLSNGGRRGRAMSLRGTVGDAGALVTLRSFSGEVIVLRR